MKTLVRHVAGGLFDALAELGAVRMTPPRDDRAAAHRLAGALGVIGRAHDLVVATRGDAYRGTALFVANHVSYLDPIAILPVCPAIPFAKHEVRDWPIIGPIGAACGVVFVQRRDRMARARALRRMHDLLEAGVPVLNFAEGTTTPGDRVAPLFRGGFGIAQRLGVPIVPIAIRYADPELAWFGGASFVPHYVRTARRPRIDVTLRIGEPMWPRAGEPPEAMAARTRSVITQLLDKETHAGIRSDVSTPRPDADVPLADDAGRQRRRGAPRRAA